MSWPVTGIEPAGEAGALDCLHDADRLAVIGNEEGVDVVVRLGQRVFGKGLRRLGLPAGRQLVHHDRDVALGDRGSITS